MRSIRSLWRLALALALLAGCQRNPNAPASISGTVTYKGEPVPAGSVVFLNVVPKPAQQKRRAQHKERVGDDSACDRRLHQRVLSGMQRGHCYDQLRQISQRRMSNPPTASPVFSATASVA